MELLQVVQRRLCPGRGRDDPVLPQYGRRQAEQA
jgi:hypothetical protein